MREYWLDAEESPDPDGTLWEKAIDLAMEPGGDGCLVTWASEDPELYEVLAAFLKTQPDVMDRWEREHHGLILREFSAILYTKEDFDHD